MSTSLETKQCQNCQRVYTSEADYLNGTNRWRLCKSKHLWVNCSCGSTLIIKKGQFPWYSPDAGMSKNAASLFNKMSEFKDLPHIPTAIMMIQQMLQQETTPIQDLSNAIKAEPIVAATLLEVASHLKMSRDPNDVKRLTDIEHSILYIGKKALAELIAILSLKSFTLNTKKFSSDHFWAEAFLTGEIAEAIALKWSATLNRDEVFICASLCNIGKIIGALIFPRNIDKIHEMVNNQWTQSTWSQAEALLKIPNHQILGEIGAIFWGFPTFVLDAIAHHHDLPNSELQAPRGEKSSHPLSVTECVSLANQLTHWVLLRPGRIDQKLIDAICDRAKISQRELDLFTQAHSHLAKRIQKGIAQ